MQNNDRVPTAGGKLISPSIIFESSELKHQYLTPIQHRLLSLDASSRWGDVSLLMTHTNM